MFANNFRTLPDVFELCCLWPLVKKHHCASESHLPSPSGSCKRVCICPPAKCDHGNIPCVTCTLFFFTLASLYYVKSYVCICKYILVLTSVLAYLRPQLHAYASAWYEPENVNSIHYVHLGEQHWSQEWFVDFVQAGSSRRISFRQHPGVLWLDQIQLVCTLNIVHIGSVEGFHRSIVWGFREIFQVPPWKGSSC